MIYFVNIVGASSLAKIVNDAPGSLTPRGVLRFFASKLAPTEDGFVLAFDLGAERFGYFRAFRK